MPRAATYPLCPSAQPDMEEARIFGLLSGTPDEPRIAYLAPGVQVDQDATVQLGAVSPTEAFRFAAVWESHRCAHFDGNQCSLGQRIVSQLPEVVDLLPVCQIRHRCGGSRTGRRRMPKVPPGGDADP